MSADTNGKITISIDGQPVEVKKGTWLLQAIRDAGIAIPTLCHHKDLKPNGNCRLCICETEDQRGRKKIVTSCNYPVRNPVTVRTDTEEIKKHRKLLAEMYLGRWPNVKVVQDVARICGASGSRFAGDMTEQSDKACILCTHCVRACDEFMLERVLGFAGRGIGRHVSMPFGEVDNKCIECTSCGFVCPTGAIQVKDEKNHPLYPEMIQKHGMKINAEMATLDPFQCRMREVGTANIVSVMNNYDLLPVMNFQYGTHEEAARISAPELKEKYFAQGTADGCWKGCSMACAKAVDDFSLKTGPYKGQQVCVDGPEYETAAGGANMGMFDPEAVIEFNFYCDTYGIDTISAATTIAFVMEAYEAGQITKEHTGGMELRFGNNDAALELLHQMARGEGFGVDVGQGVRWLREKWVREYGADNGFLKDIGMEVKGLEYSEYLTKESLAQQGGYGMAVKGPQHDEAWLIFMDQVNNQIPTFEDKAEALYYFPLFRTWFGLMGLCKIVWNDVVPADNYLQPEAHKIPEHVHNYWKFFEGVTGVELDEQKMLDQSARVYNLQRCMSYMFGRGDRESDRVPYRSVGPVTEKEYESRKERYDKQLQDVLGINPDGKTTAEKIGMLREYRLEQYEKLMDAVYPRRGWNNNGVPTVARLKELGIDLPEIVELVRDAQ